MIIKRIFVSLLVVALLAAAGVLTLPWWLGAAVRGPAREHGVEFGEYQRIGYGRWAITDVSVDLPGVRLQVDRVEAPHPLTLWWSGADAGPVNIAAWRLEILDLERAPGRGVPRLSWTSLIERFDELMVRLPPLEVAAGNVSWDEGAHEVQVGPLSMDQHGVRVTAVSYKTHQASGVFDRPRRRLVLTSETAEASVEAVLAAGGDGFELVGHWRSHPVVGTLAFADDGRWIPSTAHFETGAWNLKGAEVGLEGRYAQVEAQAVIDWSEGRYQIEARAAGEAMAGQDLPPLQVDVRAEGDASALTVAAFTLSLPGVTAELDEPFRMGRRFPATGVVSRFHVKANLADVPWGEQSGLVDGRVTLTAVRDGWPHVEAELHATDLKAGAMTFPEANLAGWIDWPQWAITSARVVDAAGSEAVIQVNGEGQTVRSSQNHVVLQEESVRRWLPEGVSFSTATLDGNLSGTWAEPHVVGTVTADTLQVGPLRPIQLSVAVSGNDLEAIASSETGGGVVRAKVHRQSDGLLIDDLELNHGEMTLLKADPGGAVILRPDWGLGKLSLSGTLGRLTVDHATMAAGTFNVTSSSLTWDWLNDWWAEVPANLPRVEDLESTVTWTPDRVAFSTRAHGVFELEEVGEVVAELRAESDGESVRIEKLEVGKADRRFAMVSGSLPVHWHRGEDGGLAMDESGDVSLEARLLPNPQFWQAWGALTGVTIRAPDVTLNLRGMWPRLTGEGRVVLQSLRVSERWGGLAWPALEALHATLDGDGDGLRIQEFTAMIDGNAVSLSGRLPLRVEDWATLRSNPLSYLRTRGEMKVEMVDADLAALARLLPDYLVPAGRASLSLDFGRGGQLDGNVKLRGAVTRPLGPLGVLQDVTADLSFAGRRATITRLRALVGGQPLLLSGSADWPSDDKLTLDLRLQGTNLPLVRKTGMLLRGDLDLAVTTSGDQTTTVSGTVNLHDGLMLADVSSLVPSGGERRATRPPYFSVEVEPFAAWRLDVSVEGQNFMRLRTPFLNGVASVQAQLDGTLLNPRAIGEVSLSEATVKLPFANFSVEEAYARLTPTNPYEPELHLRAEGKRLGYDLLMELAGTANEPRLELSSEPSLPASDVLLFVMAGVAPESEVTYSQSRRALQIGMYLGRELVGDLLGLDAADRLTVSTGEKLSRRGKETYRFGYLLDERWTLTGEYDEFDYYNAGIKWRWYPWKEKEYPVANAAEGVSP